LLLLITSTSLGYAGHCPSKASLSRQHVFKANVCKHPSNPVTDRHSSRQAPSLNIAQQTAQRLVRPAARHSHTAEMVEAKRVTPMLHPASSSQHCAEELFAETRRQTQVANLQRQTPMRRPKVSNGPLPPCLSIVKTCDCRHNLLFECSCATC